MPLITCDHPQTEDSVKSGWAQAHFRSKAVSRESDRLAKPLAISKQ
jgi:hypothetical protein